MLKEHKKIERLMLFSEVAKHLSYTLAAESLGLSRGHLSSQIRRLEQEMGMPLLLRSTRSVRLTPEGERVLAGMQKIRSSLIELERSAEQDKQDIKGVIKITAPIQFTERYLLSICADFKVQYPDIEFAIDCSYTNYDLNTNNFDLAFRATDNPPQNMIAKPLLAYQHRCCAAPAYWLNHSQPKKPSDLLKHQCLSSPTQTSWSFVDEQVKINGWFKINDNHLLKQQALLGQGVIKVPHYLVDRELKQGELISVLDEYAEHERNIYIIHPQLIHQSKRLSVFIDFTLTKFQTLTANNQ